MKKVVAFVVVFIVLLTHFSFANSPNGTVQMRMDGKTVSFNVVNLKLDNQSIQSDVPPVLLNDRTLVPIRVIMEYMNAEITWNQDQYEVTIKTTDKEIVLKIDSGMAKVNGIEKALPDLVPPKLINDRTMVPIRFVSDEIGLKVEWDNSNRTVLITTPKRTPPTTPGEGEKREEANTVVRNVRVVQKDSTSEIRIHTGQKIEELTQIGLVNPERLVVDFKNTRFDLTDKSRLAANQTLTLPMEASVIKEVRVSQFQRDPWVTRVVIELNHSISNQVTYDEQSGEMVISLINKIQNVKAATQNTKEIVVVEGNFTENYADAILMRRYENPSRLVLDFRNALLDSKSNVGFINVDGKVAKSIRVSQFNPLNGGYNPEEKVVRVVIDLQSGAQAQDVQVSQKGNQILVALEGKPYENFIYEETGWTTGRLILRGNTTTNYTVTQQGAQILQILVPKNDIHMEFTNIEIHNHLIRGIEVVDQQNSNQYLIQVELEEGVEYSIPSSTRTKDLVIDLNNRNAKYRKILVVIDPGHGGHDPGAISIDRKIKESDVVLDISLRLNQLLLDAGFRTYMTRSDDTFVSLQDRAAIANELQADLFVSVHANSATNRAAHGTENLYYPSENDPLDNRDNKRLAQAFQTEMVNRLGSNNRGIVPRDKLYVLRETKMPAVLSEVGFLSNATEEERLATPEYRQLVAEAMFNAIVKYFEAKK